MNTAKIRGIVTVASALIVAGTALPAVAQTQTQNNVVSAERTSGGASTSSRAPGADRRICVRVDLSGTRVTRNVCKTPAEWNREGGVPRD